MSKEEFMQELARQQAYNERNGCYEPLYLTIVIGIVFMLCGCATKRSTESSVEMHRMQLMTERMDSMLHATSVWQQSIYEKQSTLVDSFKHSEVRDTSHVIFLGAKGDTVRETITIREYIEREHSSSSQETERIEEKFRRTDSLLQVSLERQEKQDSILRQYQKTTVVEKQPTLGDKLKWFGGGVILALIGLFAVITAFMRKR